MAAWRYPCESPLHPVKVSENPRPNVSKSYVETDTASTQFYIVTDIMIQTANECFGTKRAKRLRITALSAILGANYIVKTTGH